MSTRGMVLAVSVGLPREFEYNGRPAKSAIWKRPVAGRVAVRGINLADDEQADRRAHGTGPIRPSMPMLWKTSAGGSRYSVVRSSTENWARISRRKGLT